MGERGKQRQQRFSAVRVVLGLLVMTMLVHLWFFTAVRESEGSSASITPSTTADKKSYKDIFQRRGELYNKAMLRSPEARLQELMPLLNELHLQPGDELIDAPAGGDYVAEGVIKYLPESISSSIRIMSVEPSTVFSQTGSASGGHGEVATFLHDASRVRHLNAPLTDIPLPPGSGTKLSSLAGLHHLSFTEKLKFFDEAFRLLTPGGRAVVADVGTGTPAAGFLNDVADRLTVTGHKGMFFREGELAAMMERSGFVDVHEEYVPLDWAFKTETELLLFVRDLFGLEVTFQDTHSPDDAVVLERVKKEVRRYLNYRVVDAGTAVERALLPWGLRYVVGNKPTKPATFLP